MIEWLAAGGLAVWALLSQRTAQQLDDVDGEPIMQFSPGVLAFAQAIARQEGFGVPGALPTVCNNPGDLTDQTGKLFGFPTRGPEHIVVFPDVGSGWDALYRQLQLIADGRSHVYTRRMTIADMAAKYAPNPDPNVWAANVAAFAGFTPDTTLDTVLG